MFDLVTSQNSGYNIGKVHCTDFITPGSRCHTMNINVLSSFLYLFFALVEVHSQTVPYVSFMGETLPNHAYVDLTLVGNPELNSGDHSLQCHTDLSSCCSGAQGSHRGDWHFPNGARLPLPGPDHDITEARGDQQVDIRRKNNANSPSGIYRCDIPTIAVHLVTNISVRDTIYVGLYNSIGGNII